MHVMRAARRSFISRSFPFVVRRVGRYFFIDLIERCSAIDYDSFLSGSLLSLPLFPKRLPRTVGGIGGLFMARRSRHSSYLPLAKPSLRPRYVMLSSVGTWPRRFFLTGLLSITNDELRPASSFAPPLAFPSPSPRVICMREGDGLICTRLLRRSGRKPTRFSVL